MLLQSINGASANIASAEKGQGFTPTGNPGLDKVLQQLDTEAKEKAEFQQNAMGAIGMGAGLGLLANSAEEDKGKGGLFGGLGALSGMFATLPEKAREGLESVISSLKNVFKGKDANVEDVSPSFLSQLTPSQTPVAAIPTPQLGQQNQTYAGRTLNA
jgi:hypothetical protein